MYVDFANDKGSYAVVRVSDRILLSKEATITWSDYRREDKTQTFGLLSQVSPDGRYVVNCPYTQLHLTHMDEQGNSSPPVLLERLTSEERAANIPEFVPLAPNAVARIEEAFLDAVSYVRAGIEFRFAGDLSSAERKYRVALDLDPRNAEANMHLGFIHLVRGELAQSRERLLDAIKLNPSNAESHYHLGVTLARQGSANEAVKMLSASLLLAPDYALAHAALGVVLDRQNRTDDAVRHYTHAIRFDADLSAARQDLARLLARLGRWSDVIATLDEGLRRNAVDAELRGTAGDLAKQALAAGDTGSANRLGRLASGATNP
jgi:tetratricopeptide (TPR) repeat protein